MEVQEEQATLQPLISATQTPPNIQQPPDVPQYQAPPAQLSPNAAQYQQSQAWPMDPQLQQPPNGSPAETPSAALVATPDEEVPGPEAMTTQEALRMYAPQQKIREKIIADHKKGLSPEDVATKHGVAPSTVHVVLKRYQQAESMLLSKSTRWRRKKAADAEEAARKAEAELNGGAGAGVGVGMCGEPDFVKMRNQGACVACTVKFQNVALGKMDKNGANIKRSRTQFGCRNCRVHLCRKGYCWDIFHKHAKG